MGRLLVLLVVVTGCGSVQMSPDAGSDDEPDAAGATVDAGVDAGPVTAVFREGSTYAGTVDTWIQVSFPDQDYSATTALSWSGSADIRYALLRFDQIFGTGANQVPIGANVISASISVTMYTSSTATVVIDEVAIGWSDTTTWNTFGSIPGVQTTDRGVNVASETLTGSGTIDVTASLRAWSADPTANRGWMFSGVVGVPDAAIYSSESPAMAPVLAVTYFP